jgi:uncharacterized MnhB-related membrane protein
MTPAGETALQLAMLGALGIVGPVVVLTRDPPAQALALTFYGLVLGVLFLALQAPDVALAQFVVGAVALPIMVLLTLARMRRQRERSKKEQGEGGHE